MAELLFEIFSEEIPARMQRWAADVLLEKAKNALPQNLYEEANSFVTPRRLTLVVKGLVAQVAEEVVETRGPKVGAPQRALEGFLKASGLTKDRLEVREANGVEYYFAVRTKPSVKMADHIKTVLEEMLIGFVWPKSMRWGSHQCTWVRPIKSILCILDGVALDIDFCSIRASNKTYGHRFMSGEKELLVKNFAEYQNMLRDAFVVLDQNERKAMIVDQVNALAAKLGCVVRDDPELIDEITGLVEFPNALSGKIETKFMQLPKEVLMTSMRTHQRYISLLNNDGSLAPYFITVANVKTKNDAVVVAGNEKVLRARLEDALFFWNSDLKNTLESRLPLLEKLGFHEKLGSIYQKTLRVVELAKYLAPLAGASVAHASKAALLCKTDLVTEMVGEFPELQGVIGQYYAQQEGLTKQISDAIGQHYLPMGLKDNVASTKEAATISIVDKMDSLVGMFSIGEKPTGSKDPFGLRRAAIGIIRIINEHQLNFDLEELISKSLHLYGKENSAIQKELVEFFEDRIKNFMKSEEIDVAVLNVAVKDINDIYDTIRKTHILSEFLLSENGKAILSFYQRAANIVSIEERKNQAHYHLAKVDKALFEQREEHRVAESLVVLQKSLADARNFDEKLGHLVSVKDAVNDYLDHTMINAPDAKIRANRLALLAHLTQTMNQVVDLSIID